MKNIYAKPLYSECRKCLEKLVQLDDEFHTITDKLTVMSGGAQAVLENDTLSKYERSMLKLVVQASHEVAEPMQSASEKIHQFKHALHWMEQQAWEMGRDSNDTD